MLGYYRFPTIFKNRIVFVSEDDLWSVDINNPIAVRLTSNYGEISYPLISKNLYAGGPITFKYFNTSRSSFLLSVTSTLSKFKSLSGEASFRKLYSNKNNIIVFSKKNIRKNLLIYDAINKI